MAPPSCSPSSPRGLYLQGQKRRTFKCKDSLDGFVSLVFDSNLIASFAGLPSLPRLKRLYLDHTRISSFESAPKLPSLELISLRDTPISHYKCVRTMVIIVFGSQLQFVNGKATSPREASTGDRFRESVYDYLRAGWIMSSTKPLRLFHPTSRKRIGLAQPPPLPSPPSSRSETVIEDLDPDCKLTTQNVADQVHHELTQRPTWTGRMRAGPGSPAMASRRKFKRDDSGGAANFWLSTVTQPYGGSAAPTPTIDDVRATKEADHRAVEEEEEEEKGKSDGPTSDLGA